MTITPGAYLKHRRTAAGLTPADIAARLHVEPYRFDVRARAEWIELIEADAQPMDVDLVVALREIYQFDLRVVLILSRIAQGFPANPPRLCRVCACSWEDPCIDTARNTACAWAEPDLCTACVGTPAADAIQAVAA